MSIRLLAAFALLGLSGAALAQTSVTEPQEWGKKIKAAENLAALGTDLFGDSTNFYDGTTTFAVTDIDLPGNNALPVRLGRTLLAEEDESSGSPRLLGDWELDIPYISGVFSQQYG